LDKNFTRPVDRKAILFRCAALIPNCFLHHAPLNA
jgi:hypothetical protein